MGDAHAHLRGLHAAPAHARPGRDHHLVPVQRVLLHHQSFLLPEGFLRSHGRGRHRNRGLPQVHPQGSQDEHQRDGPLRAHHSRGHHDLGRVPRRSQDHLPFGFRAHGRGVLGHRRRRRSRGARKPVGRRIRPRVGRDARPLRRGCAGTGPGTPRDELRGVPPPRPNGHSRATARRNSWAPWHPPSTGAAWSASCGTSTSWPV